MFSKSQEIVNLSEPDIRIETIGTAVPAPESALLVKPGMTRFLIQEGIFVACAIVGLGVLSRGRAPWAGEAPLPDKRGINIRYPKTRGLRREVA